MIFDPLLVLLVSSFGTNSIRAQRQVLDALASPSDERPRVSCFICGWVEDFDKCGDTNFSLVHEEPGHYMVRCHVCYKKVLYNASDAKIRVLRGCVVTGHSYELGCQYTYYQDGVYEEVCACATDYCNNGALRGDAVQGPSSHLESLNNASEKLSPASLFSIPSILLLFYVVTGVRSLMPFFGV